MQQKKTLPYPMYAVIEESCEGGQVVAYSLTAARTAAFDMERRGVKVRVFRVDGPPRGGRRQEVEIEWRKPTEG